MPRVDFRSLPDDARTWVFAADRPLPPPAADRLLGEVDGFLDAWAAHGQPLTCARDWREDRFLAIAVDGRDAHASGCSIDGLFRVLQRLEPQLGASLLGGGRVLYRDASGAVRTVSRDEFSTLATQGTVTGETRVFDATVSTAGAWRERFEKPAAESWHAALL
jgi:hypothetical protein